MRERAMSWFFQRLAYFSLIPSDICMYAAHKWIFKLQFPKSRIKFERLFFANFERYAQKTFARSLDINVWVELLKKSSHVRKSSKKKKLFNVHEYDVDFLPTIKWLL